MCYWWKYKIGRYFLEGCLITWMKTKNRAYSVSQQTQPGGIYTNVMRKDVYRRMLIAVMFVMMKMHDFIYVITGNLTREVPAFTEPAGRARLRKPTAAGDTAMMRVCDRHRGGRHRVDDIVTWEEWRCPLRWRLSSLSEQPPLS